MGNPWIAQQRSVFKDEVEAHKSEIAAMLLSEGDAVQTCEALVNRVSLMRANGHPSYSLMQMLHSGFYGPINRQGLPRLLYLLKASGKTNAMFAAIDAVMAGSDTIKGFTDQGLKTDPNGWRTPRVDLGGNVYNDWNGGPGYMKAAAWRAEFESNAVKALQTALNKKLSPEMVLNKQFAFLDVDGSFGPETLNAVKVFQQQNGLTVDGIPGEATWKALEA